MFRYLVGLILVAFCFQVKAQKQLYFSTQFFDGIHSMQTDGSELNLIRAKINPEDFQLDLNNNKFIWTDSQNKSIQRCDLDGSNLEEIISALEKPTGLSIDQAKAIMYWVDNKTVYQSNLDGSGIQMVYELDVEIADIVFDEASKLYWMDKSSRVGVYDLTTDTYEIIHTQAYSPEDIEIDVDDQLLFIAQNAGVGQNSGVYSMNLDGSGKRRLDPDRSSILGLEVDPINNRVYYGEFIFNNIHRIDYDGNEEDVFENGGLPSPEDIVVTTHMPAGENLLYYVDPGYRDLIISAKLDGTSKKTIFQNPMHNPAGMAIDKESARLFYVNQPSGFASDRGDSVYSCDLDGSNPTEVLPYSDSRVAHAVALDEVNKKLYVALGTRIIRVNYDGSDLETLYNISGSSIYDIRLDLEGKMIYWTNLLEDKIQRGPLDGGEAEDLIVGLNIPYALDVDFREEKIYWTDLGARAVLRSNFDGSELDTLVESLSTPHGIDIDPIKEKMYVCADRNIFSADLDGGNIVQLNSDQARGAERILLYNPGDGSAVEDFDRSTRIKIFPNPVVENLNIELEVGQVKLELFTQQGLRVLALNFEEQKQRINLDKLAAGIYFAQFTFGDGKIQTHKILKTN